MSSDRSNRLERLHEAGVSIWLAMLSRDLLDSGAFAALIADVSRVDTKAAVGQHGDEGPRVTRTEDTTLTSQESR